MASYTREYEYGGSSGTKLRVTLTTTATSIPNNTTTERVKVDFIHTGTSFNNTPYTASLNFNGTARTKTFSYSGAGTINLWNFTQVVPHNTNGTKTANLTITDNRHNSPYTTTVSVNDNFVLDVIPRNAVFTSVPDNIEIEKPFTVTFDRRGATTVDIGIYNTSGGGTFVPYIEDIEGTSFTFELDEDEKNRFYNNMPTSTSKKYRFYLKSDIGETVFSEKTFKIKAEIPSLPVFTHEDINATTLALTGSNQIYIQNYSDLKLNITTATAFQGATITKYTVINGSKSKDYTSSGIKTDFGKVVAQQLQAIITDSRGFTSQSIISLDYIPYTQPTIQNFLLNREIGTSTKADLITNGLYTNVNFGAVANKVKKVEYRKKSTGDYGSWIDITGKVVYGAGLFNNGTNQQINDFVFGTEFTVEIKISDELSFNTRTAVVSKGLFTAIVDNQVYGSVGIGELPLEETNSLIVKGNIYAPNLKPSFTKLRLSGQFNINVSGNITNWTINSQYNSDLTTNGTNITLSKGIYKISGSLFYRHLAGAGALQASVYLVHNSTDITRIGISTTAANLYVPIPFPGQIIEVSENDTIKVRYEGFGTSGYLSASIATYLNIEKIGD